MALTVVWKLSYATKDGLLPIQREKCGLGLWLHPLPLQITLRDFKGNAYNPSISLKRVYGKPNEEEIPMETALLFMSVVENIFWRFAGMTHAASLRIGKRLDGTGKSH